MVHFGDVRRSQFFASVPRKLDPTKVTKPKGSKLTQNTQKYKLKLYKNIHEN